MSTKATIRMTVKQRLLLILLLGAQFMLSVDFSILNVALPDIGQSLHFNLNNLQWIATAFSLTAAGFTLFFGRVADLLGRRWLFLFGIAMLGIGSLIGGLAQTQAMLLVARIIQGLSTAIVTPAALALLTNTFTEGPLRDKALGLNGALLSGGFTVGSLAGGVLTGLLNWRWAFFINVPIALAIFILTPFYVQESRVATTRHLDAPGALAVTGGLLALVYGLTILGSGTSSSTSTLLALVVAFILLLLFWLIEGRSKLPLISLNLLRKPTVLWGNIGGMLIFAMETSMVFLTTLYLQKVLNFSPTITGLTFGSLGLAAFVTGIYGPRFIERLSSQKTLVWGLLVQGATTMSLLFTGQNHTWLIFVLVVTTLGGFGHMTGLVSYLITATSGVESSESGAVSGLISMSQLVSISLGVPIMSALINTRINSLQHATSKSALLQGYHFAIIINGALTILGALLIYIRLRIARQRAIANQPVNQSTQDLSSAESV